MKDVAAGRSMTTVQGRQHPHGGRDWAERSNLPTLGADSPLWPAPKTQHRLPGEGRAATTYGAPCLPSPSRHDLQRRPGHRGRPPRVRLDLATRRPRQRSLARRVQLVQHLRVRSHLRRPPSLCSVDMAPSAPLLRAYSSNSHLLPPYSSPAALQRRLPRWPSSCAQSFHQTPASVRRQ